MLFVSRERQSLGWIGTAMCLWVIPMVIVIGSADSVSAQHDSLPSPAPQRYSQYVDAATGVVKTPPGFAHDDDCWRSSWFWASVLIIHNRGPELYRELVEQHGISLEQAHTFLKYFRDNCLGDQGWRRPTSLRDNMTHDQLVPLLYLLACVDRFGTAEMKETSQTILKSLRTLEENGRRLSEHGQLIGRNIGYMIDVLSDEGHYNGVYRTADMEFWRITALGDERAAKANRRAGYKAAFTAGLKAHEAGQDYERFVYKFDFGPLNNSVPLLVNDYSVFNALAATSFQAVYWGPEDADVRTWRANFEAQADDGWGPAYKIVAGRPCSHEEIDAYRDAHVTRAWDNDILLAQRGRRLSSGELHPNLKGGDGQWLVLDFVVLKALELIWK